MRGTGTEFRPYNTDWWNYGGLTRSVERIEVPDTFIEDYSVQLAKGSSDQIEGWIQWKAALTDSFSKLFYPQEICG